MTVAADEIITAVHYEALRNKVSRILGKPTGSWFTGSIGTTAGYNQTVSAPVKLINDTITSAEWNAVRSDIIKCYVHQVGNEPQGVDELTEVVVGDTIDAATYNLFESVISTITAGRNTVASTQRSLTSATTGTLTATWNGQQTHAFTMTWDNVDHKKGWINAGGTLRFTGSATGTPTKKDTDWASILNGIGQVEINNLSMTKSSFGSLNILQNGPTYNGWWYLDSLPLNTVQTIYTTSGLDHAGYSEYDENFYEIKFLKRSDTQYEFRVLVNDADQGDPSVDENVNADITSTVQVFTATGAYVSLDAPVFAEKTPTNTFNYT